MFDTPSGSMKRRFPDETFLTFARKIRTNRRNESETVFQAVHYQRVKQTLPQA